MDEMDFTRKFRLGDQRDLEIKAILASVYQALQEKGYNPVNQIVGYILSEDHPPSAGGAAAGRPGGHPGGKGCDGGVPFRRGAGPGPGPEAGLCSGGPEGALPLLRPGANL